MKHYNSNIFILFNTFSSRTIIFYYYSHFTFNIKLQHFGQIAEPYQQVSKHGAFINKNNDDNIK